MSDEQKQKMKDYQKQYLENMSDEEKKKDRERKKIPRKYE